MINPLEILERKCQNLHVSAKFWSKRDQIGPSSLQLSFFQTQYDNLASFKVRIKLTSEQVCV